MYDTKIWWCSKERWKCDRGRQESCLLVCLHTDAFCKHLTPPPPADRCTSLMFIWETRLDFISYWWLFQCIPCCFLLQYFEWFVLFYFENLHLSILKKVVHRHYPILIISVSGCNYPWVFFPSSDMIQILWFLYLLIQRTDMMPEWN